MAQPYNLTGMSQSNSLFEFVYQSNILTGNLMGILIIITTFIIAFLNMKDYEGKKAFAGSSFITALISIFLRVLGMITDQWMFGVFIVAGLSFIWLRWD